MENPKVRIESDGQKTEVYINGEKASWQVIDFHSSNDALGRGGVICTLIQNVFDNKSVTDIKDSELTRVTTKLL
jgi:hypothetical protein